MKETFKSWFHVTGAGRQGLKSFSQFSMAETDLSQLDEPGKAIRLAGRPTGALRGADEGMRCLFLPGSSFLQ